MAGRCCALLVKLREGGEGLEGSKALRLADELEPCVTYSPLSPAVFLSVGIAYWTVSTSRHGSGPNGVPWTASSNKPSSKMTSIDFKGGSTALS